MWLGPNHPLTISCFYDYLVHTTIPTTFRQTAGSWSTFGIASKTQMSSLRGRTRASFYFFIFLVSNFILLELSFLPSFMTCLIWHNSQSLSSVWQYAQKALGGILQNDRSSYKVSDLTIWTRSAYRYIEWYPYFPALLRKVHPSLSSLFLFLSCTQFMSLLVLKFL